MSWRSLAASAEAWRCFSRSKKGEWTTPRCTIKRPLATVPRTSAARSRASWSTAAVARRAASTGVSPVSTIPRLARTLDCISSGSNGHRPRRRNAKRMIGLVKPRRSASYAAIKSASRVLELVSMPSITASSWLLRVTRCSTPEGASSRGWINWEVFLARGNRKRPRSRAYSTVSARRWAASWSPKRSAGIPELRTFHTSATLDCTAIKVPASRLSESFQLKNRGHVPRVELGASSVVNLTDASLASGPLLSSRLNPAQLHVAPILPNPRLIEVEHGVGWEAVVLQKVLQLLTEGHHPVKDHLPHPLVRQRLTRTVSQLPPVPVDEPVDSCPEYLHTPLSLDHLAHVRHAQRHVVDAESLRHGN